MTLDRALFALALLGVCFLAFIGGAFSILTKVFPYSILDSAYLAATALYEQRTQYGTPFQTDLWRRARTPAQGVTRFDPERAENGYTLFTSGDGAYARLIDMQGNVVHEWRKPYSEVWDESAPLQNPRPDRFIYMRRAAVLPSGDLLALYIASGDTPWGYGLVKLDEDNNVIWRYLEHTHHDFDVGPDGRIYTLIHKYSPRPPGVAHLSNPYLEDFLVVLSAKGEELERISLRAALQKSRYSGYLYATPPISTGDPLHTNSVHRLTREEAAAVPNAKAGDVLLSFREVSLIAVLDIEQRRIIWATTGSWFRQHDPSVLANGDILLYDNLGGFQPGNATRILEIDPQTTGVTWRYRGSPQHPLESKLRGAAQRLGNGNTLITESDGGRLLEVTKAGEIVWEYVNPIRGGPGKDLIPVVSGGRRIKASALDPAFRETLPP